MALITSIYMCGLFLGSLICSTSDRFGRKAVLVVSWALAAVGGVANAFVKSYAAFCVLRFFTGAGEIENQSLIKTKPYNWQRGCQIICSLGPYNVR